MTDGGFDADKIRQQLTKAVQEHRGRFLFTGILSIIVGSAAILLPHVATIAVEIMIGWLFVIVGVAQSLQIFQTHGARNILGGGVRAVLSVVVGVLLLLFPPEGVITLTLLLVAFFAAEGISRIVIAFKLRPEKLWFWCLLGGVANLAFAVIVWAMFPGSAAFILGLLVGVDMLMFGWTMILLVNTAGKT